MAVFYSPDGNPEIWESKPAGYFTPKEWLEKHPPVPEPPPTPEQLEKQFSAAVGLRLDEFAALKDYDSMDKARLTLLSDAFHTDGAVAQKAYDDTWQVAIELMPQVSSGALAVDEALGQLPPLAWPEG